MTIKTIDLCAGIGGIRLGFELACKAKGINHSCVFASDISKNACKVYRDHFGNDPDPMCDITKVEPESIPDFDVLFGGFPCFVSGTMIVTKNGLKTIESVDSNDMLMTHTGEYREINNLQTKIYSGELLDIKIKHHHALVSCTPEHPFYVRKRTKAFNTHRRGEPFCLPASYADPQWVKASELDEDCFVGTPINNKSIIPSFVKHIKKGNQHNNHLVEHKVVLSDPDQWYMMGYFVGDGWCEDCPRPDRGVNSRSYKIGFSVNQDDFLTVLPRLQKILPLTDKLSDSGTCKKYGCASELWYSILSQFGKYAHGKRLPSWVEDAPAEMLKHFVDGYYDADGSMSRQGRAITSVSSDLLYGIQRLALKLGIITHIRQTHMACRRLLLGRMVNQRDCFRICGFDQNARICGAFVEGGYCWYKVAKISTKAVHEIPVYNFEVNIDNSYCVMNLAVHNCQPFSSSGHRKGFDDLRGTLFFNIAEIVKVKRPSAILLENVKGLVNHDGGKTMNRIMTALRDQLGYVTYSQVLNSKHFGVPQNRPRIYIVAFDSHKKVNGVQIGQGFKFPEENGPDVRLSSILQPNPVDERYYLSKSYWETLLRHRKNHEAKGHGFGYEIKTGNDIANTIMCGGMGKERNLIRDDSQRELPDWANTDRIRTMTPIEWEKLQGINEGWTEAAPVSSRMRLLGNSVTVPVIQAVSEKMLDAMVNPGTIEAF